MFKVIKVVYLNSMTLILPNKRERYGYRMSDQPTYLFKGLLLIWKRKKIIFLKIDKNTILQTKVSTPQIFKRKIHLIFKISLE